MKNILDRLSIPLFAATLLLCASFAHSQVSVAIAPNLHPKFTDNSGVTLSNGFLYTYQAGTTTLQNTYADSFGIVQNADPIPLDATGAPSNGSTQTGIWLANASYKFCAYNSALVQQWCTDNVTSYLGLLNFPNLWTFQQTFSLPIVDTQVDNQIVLGAVGNQTTLDFPPPTGNIVLHFPNTSGTVLTNNAPVITNPTINGIALTTPLPLEVVLFKSAVAVTHTGDLAEDTIWTATIPALSSASQIRVTYSVNPTVQDANLTTYRVRLNGVQVCIVNGAASHANFFAMNRCTITNRGATNSQVSALETLGDTTPVVIGNFAATAIDTSVSRTLTVTATNTTTAANSQVFDFATVTLLP